MTINWPVVVPSAVGVKVTLRLQLAPGATVAPHVLEDWKSPVVATLLICRVVVPGLERTITWGLGGCSNRLRWEAE